MNTSNERRLTATSQQKANLAQAVRATVGIVSEHPGSDCLLYALVGAEALRLLGADAHAEAGSAVWRVGPGDDDVIAHATEVHGQAFMPAYGSSPAAPMHAWIRLATPGAPSELVDFTTWQLRKKAAALDAADQGHTTVQYCPDYVWEALDHATRLAPMEVVQSFDVGVHAYLPKQHVTEAVLRADRDPQIVQLACLATTYYQMLDAGQPVRIIGVDSDGLYTANESAPLHLIAL